VLAGQDSDDPLAHEVFQRFKAALERADAVLFQIGPKDFSPGLSGRSTRGESCGKIVCIDPKLRNLAAHQPATVITPNTQEAERASGIAISNTRELVRASKKIINLTRVRYLLVTRGEKGMALLEGDSRGMHIPTVAREVFDVTGAGDTVISTFALALVSRLSILEAAVLSNITAGIVGGKLGTASVTPEELVSRLRDS
jgi:D-beta-D-heptose 7-phosphate kinase / D-beta-D-heptose 1-phosphate adenosyltransferase